MTASPISGYRWSTTIVIRPGWFYSVTYYKPENSPQLLAKRMADHDDLRISMTAAEFLTEAWRLANDKARELGWICLSGFGAMPTTSASGIKRTFAFAKLSQLLTRNGLLIGEIANLASSAMALSISRIDHSVGTQKSIVAARTFRQRDLFCIAALIGSGTSAGSNRL